MAALEFQNFTNYWQAQSSNGGSWLSTLLKIVANMWHWILTRIYLRKTNAHNWSICKGRPSIQAKGNIHIAEGVKIWSKIQKTRLSVFEGGTLQIGKNTFINGARIAAKTQIIIGNNCNIAPDVVIMDNDFHDIADQEKAGKAQPITIGNNVWIATRAIILKGVTIGNGAVVAAGAVVTKNVAANTVVAGVPARIIQQKQDL